MIGVGEVVGVTTWGLADNIEAGGGAATGTVGFGSGKSGIYHSIIA